MNSAPKVKVVSVRCFEVFTPSGESLGLFRVESEWKGLASLEAIVGDGELIIGPPKPGIFGTMFDNIFGEHRSESPVVGASPDLLQRIGGGAEHREGEQP